MARFITETRNVSNLPGDQISPACNEDFLIGFDVDPDPSRPIAMQTSLFLRVTETSPNGTGDVLRFAGYVSDSYAMLDEVNMGELDPKRTQYVEGTAFPSTNKGTVRPADD